MVLGIRHIEAALGDARKHVTDSEAKNKPIARKSIVARRDIKAGELLTEENLAVKRPGTGISPMLWDSVVGTHAIKDFPYDTLIEIN
jgi:N,N'-diacetyllegionaminate synthase